MKVCAIICEYNPFHKGHAYHIARARELSGADYIVCVMSGAFVQRAEPAIIDKYKRTQMALSCGVDAVFELPCVYACACAEHFAGGAVSLINSLGICTHISFGIDTEFENIIAAAQLTAYEDTDYADAISDYLDEGLSHPAARKAAALKQLGIAGEALTLPNSILAVEYCKAITKSGSRIIPVPIQRAGAGYHDSECSDAYPSATAIRRSMYEGRYLEAFSALPENAAIILSDILVSGAFVPQDGYDPIAIYSLRKATAEYLASLPDTAEGLENRFKKYANLPTLSDIWDAIKVKRYTHSRIRRITAQAVLGISRDYLTSCDYQSGPSYARLLGFKSNAKPLISAISKSASIPIITSCADALKTLPESAKNMLEKDILASDIQSLTMKNPQARAGGQDFTTKLITL